jgi:hypothetical protein
VDEDAGEESTIVSRAQAVGSASSVAGNDDEDSESEAACIIS